MLPLETNPWERVPTTRILQMLKYLATEKLGPKSQQIWVSIILFRCFLEGFGTTPNFRTAGLIYAVWQADSEAVKCLLDVGAKSDLVCFHVAAGMHLVNILELLLSYPAGQVLTIDQCELEGVSLLETALSLSRVFSVVNRLSRTRTSLAVSTKAMVDFLAALWKPTQNSPILSDTMCSLCKLDAQVPSILCDVFRVSEGFLLSGHSVIKALNTSIMLGDLLMVQNLLDIIKPQDSLEPEIIRNCATFLKDSSKFRTLVNKNGFNINRKYPDKSRTDLDKPFQIAVATQNFDIASFLIENGAKCDELILSPFGSCKDYTLLGWLIPIIWSESRRRIQYIFEEYPQDLKPHFIVAPRVGKSALQHAASHAPASKWDENDTENMMDYLISKYPGSRHLEYQRIDDSSRVQNDTQHAALVHTIVDGKSMVVRNNYHFKLASQTYEPTSEKEYNGTALFDP